jgi:hypothetical protein
MRAWASPAECEKQRERADASCCCASADSLALHWYPLAAADGLMSLRISFPSLFLFHFVNHRILADLQLLVHIAVVIDYVVAFLFSCELRNTFTIR